MNVFSVQKTITIENANGERGRPRKDIRVIYKLSQTDKVVLSFCFALNCFCPIYLFKVRLWLPIPCSIISSLCWLTSTSSSKNDLYTMVQQMFFNTGKTFPNCQGERFTLNNLRFIDRQLPPFSMASSCSSYQRYSFVSLFDVGTIDHTQPVLYTRRLYLLFSFHLKNRQNISWAHQHLQPRKRENHYRITLTLAQLHRYTLRHFFTAVNRLSRMSLPWWLLFEQVQTTPLEICFFYFANRMSPMLGEGVYSTS